MSKSVAMQAIAMVANCSEILYFIRKRCLVALMDRGLVLRLFLGSFGSRRKIVRLCR